MGIPESQLDTWSHQGPITQSKDTYAAVKRCLESTATAFAGKDFNVFLQGSYGNDTNIYTESDVDVVVRLDSTFHYDIAALTEEEQNAFHALTGGSANYSYFDFKRDVVAALQGSFGQDVANGKKAIAIAASGNRRKSDVIAAAEFRRYKSFSHSRTDDYVSGICFFANTIDRVVNYPRQHSANLTTKHQAVSSWFKPSVRILKNMRRRMEADGLISSGLAPSYFLEGLLYNVPIRKFGSSYQSTMVNAINWIVAADRSQFVCANAEYYLLRDIPHTCWQSADCDSFLNALVKFWDNWQ